MNAVVWMPVVGDEGFYEVSDSGNVRSINRIIWKAPAGRIRRRGAPMATGLSPKGYRQVHLCKDGKAKTKRVSGLVAAAFLGAKPDGLETCHRDGNCANDAARNLRYDTPAGNAADKIAHGTKPYGERTGVAKLSDAIVRCIREERTPIKDLAARYGVHESTIERAKDGRTWAHL